MKTYKVILLDVVNNKAIMSEIKVTCKDVATEVWLNPTYKHVLEVIEL